ncbi:PREDICTED: pentatricopeptide repeat-containing protein At3g51320 [Tarenaya hassleriana]|uniref:pentatricopeptide repeat-containing protein At3g51320 n=1 Tax=Tarenaya hassleriana TaxID=28532 RepID=UPI00053C5881|nr:PREDICTED: pentatricopeptide repeat-containing protein At3g51320 [Tarenaya hassleriana]
MARASSTRQLLRSRPTTLPPSSDPLDAPAPSFVRSFKLLNKSRAIGHLFQFHSRLITSGLFRDPSWSIRLLKCSSLFGDAGYTLSIFRCIGKLYCANTVIKAYSISSSPQQACGFYCEMLRYGFVPDSYTFVSLFGSIEKTCCINSGKMCHGQAIKHGFDQVLPVQNSLIAMYASGGARELADKVFAEIPKRDIVSWNSMISGLVRDADLGFAHNMFDQMPDRNVISWNIMISAYLDAGNPGVSLKLFRQMVGAGFRGNDRTVVLLLRACGRSARLKEGRSVHASLLKTLLNSNVIIDTALIDMYCKCKEVESGRRIFDSLSLRNVITWNVMILGHCLHGYPQDGLELFESMGNQTKFKRRDSTSELIPDEITFIGVLCACARAGLVSQGESYYTQMVDEFEIRPNFGHLWCMSNLYAGAGLVQEAQEMLKKLPEEDGMPESSRWASLLSTSRFTGNTAMGESIAKLLIEGDPLNYTYYRLLMNVYAVAGRWKDVERVREVAKEKKVVKVPGCNLVDLKDIVHDLQLGDKEADSVNAVVNEFWSC